MDKNEKIEIMKNAFSYTNCLNCVHIKKGDTNYDYTYLTTNTRSSNKLEICKINYALYKIGLDPHTVDLASAIANIVEGGGPIGLSEGKIDKCVKTSKILEIIERLIDYYEHERYVHCTSNQEV